jgi:hypothetical protein
MTSDRHRVDDQGIVHIVRFGESRVEYGSFECEAVFDEGYYGNWEAAKVQRVEPTTLPATCLACIVAR